MRIYTAIEKPDLDENLLEHHGTKGMKWGVRKDSGHVGESARTHKISRLDKKFAKNTMSPKLAIKLHNRAAELTNKNDVARINNKPQYKNADFRRDSPLRQKYYAEHQKAFIDNLDKAATELGTNASGTQRYQILEQGDGAWNIVLTDVKHADGSVAKITVVYDTMGKIISLKPAVISLQHYAEVGENFLRHFGVRGMHWGVRQNRAPGVSSKTDRHARKDAKEFARAKMFYGKGAGTRRKLIKAKVEATSKRNPSYKKAFDHHLAAQDMSSHADKAQSERGRKNRIETGRKTTGAILRRATGEMGTSAAVVTAAAVGYAYLKSPQGKQFMAKTLASLNG